MRYPLMNDDNGDGIPDGAKVTISYVKTKPTPATDQAREQALDGGMIEAGRGGQVQFRGRVDDATRLLERPRPAFGATNAAQIAQAAADYDGFQERTAAAADMYGLRRTNTTRYPVMTDNVKAGLAARAEDLSLAPARRQAAGRRLDEINTMLDRAAGRRTEETIAASQERGMIGKATAERDARVDAATAYGDARVQAGAQAAEAAKYAADQRLAGEQAKSEALAKREAVRNQMAMDARAERAAAREARTTDQRRNWIHTALDKEYSPNGVSKETLRGYMVETRDQNGNVRPDAKQDPVWESRLDSLEAQAREWGESLYGSAKTAPPAEMGKAADVPPVEGAVKSPSRGWVKLRPGGNRSNPDDWIPVSGR